MTRELASLRHITMYGDLLMELPPDDVVLAPASSHLEAQHLSLIGSLPNYLRGSTEKLRVSLKSSKAQAGLEIADLQVDPNAIFVLLANCGPYWLKILSGDDGFDTGALYSISEGIPHKADIFQYMSKLQAKNPWLTDDNMQHLVIGGQHYVWIETDTLIGPSIEQTKHHVKVVNDLPRGSDREKLGRYLDRRVISRRGSEKYPPKIISGNVPYATTQTEYPVIPVDGMGLIIQGSALLNNSGKIISHLVHGASQLVAQPDCTMKEGRSEHPIIAEFFSTPIDVIRQWKSKLRLGFFAQPVHLSVNS